MNKDKEIKRIKGIFGAAVMVSFENNNKSGLMTLMMEIFESQI